MPAAKSIAVQVKMLNAGREWSGPSRVLPTRETATKRTKTRTETTISEYHQPKVEPTQVTAEPMTASADSRSMMAHRAMPSTPTAEPMKTVLLTLVRCSGSDGTSPVGRSGSGAGGLTSRLSRVSGPGATGLGGVLISVSYLTWMVMLVAVSLLSRPLGANLRR